MKKEAPIISFLITHFNRPTALKTLVDSIKNLNLSIKYEIIVSDDFSDESIISQIKNLDINNLILADRNLGLANNINKGIKVCKGEYILYCQEDFIVKENFKLIADELLILLKEGQLDMIRLTANYKFPHLIKLSKNISLIPKLSIRNSFYNHYRYSDHPFIVKKNFFNHFGYYLEDTSAGFGESEYMVRMMNSKVKIGITNEYYFENNIEAKSVNDGIHSTKKKKFMFPKVLMKFLRSFRYLYELFSYNPNIRKLKTYKNYRKNKK